MKRYILEVEVDEHGECFITLPDEMLDETGWNVGTMLEWEEETDGSIVLHEIKEQLKKIAMEKNGVPEFKSESEMVAWSLQQLSEGLKNLAQRITYLEVAVGKMPPPGADMVKYKIPGNDEYSNLKELFDDLYDRLNRVEKLK